MVSSIRFSFLVALLLQENRLTYGVRHDFDSVRDAHFVESFLELKERHDSQSLDDGKAGHDFNGERPLLKKNMFPVLGRWDPTKDNPNDWKKWVPIGVLVVVTLGLCLFCVGCCRTRAEDQSGGESSARRPLDANSPEGLLHDLKSRKAKLLVQQVVNKQRLERIMSAIAQAENDLEDQRQTQEAEQDTEQTPAITISAACEAGARTLQLSEVGDFQAGDVVKIGTALGPAEHGIISSVEQGAIILTNPLENVYENGIGVKKDAAASYTTERAEVGAASLMVKDVAGFSAGDKLIVGTSPDAKEEVAIESLAPGTIITKMPLVDAYEAGTLVKKAPGRKGQPTPEEIEKMAWEAERGTELMAQRGLLAALSYAAPFAMQGRRVYETVDKRMASAREKAATVFMSEMKSLGKDVSETLELGESSRFTALSNLELPAVSLLVASAFAPAQLRYHYYMDMNGIMLKALSLVFSGIVLVVDRPGTCPTEFVFSWLIPDSGWRAVRDDVYMWFALDFFVCGLSCLIRIWFMKWVETTLDEIERPPPNVVADSPLHALRELTDYYVTTGGEALIKLDTMLTSNVYALANWSCVFDFFWMLFATDLMLNTPWADCKRLELVVLRFRVVVFLILFIPNLSILMGFLGSRFLNKTSLNVAVLGTADSIDEILQLGFPLARVMAHATLVRDAGDMVSLELRVQVAERARLEKHQQDQAAALAAIEGQQAAVEKKIEALQQQKAENQGKSRNQVFYEQHEKMKKAILDHSESLFRRANARAKVVAQRTSEQFKDWEEGEGGAFIRSTAGATMLDVDPVQGTDPEHGTGSSSQAQRQQVDSGANRVAEQPEVGGVNSRPGAT